MTALGVTPRARAACRRVLSDKTIPATGDDRSGVYITMIGSRNALGDSVGAHVLTREWADFLDREAAAAPTPAARTVFDSHRLSAYLELGEPEKAIPFLEQSQKDAPEDYNPPARLALAYKAMKKWPEAIAASDRALAIVYGPRTLVVLNARTDIYVGMGDTANARKTVEKSIAFAEALPPGQRSDRTIASLKKKLAGMSPATQ